MFESYPILGICGFSGSGKTTLIEAVIPKLTARGLAVAAVKCDAHHVEVDKPGKDSDRYFRAGADVFLRGDTEDFTRIHAPDERGLNARLAELARSYDLLLLEGGKHLSIPKIWLQSEGGDTPPGDVTGIELVLSRGENRTEALMTFIDRWLPVRWLKTPVYGCILIGGRSGRVGQPKHLIAERGRTWFERTVSCLQPHVEIIAAVGGGDLPTDVVETFGIVRFPDISDAGGPLAGMLACMRWAPDVSWIVTSCDLPDMTSEAVGWLVSKRAPGVWAVLPLPEGSNYIEPLFAYYDLRSHRLLEIGAAEGVFRPAQIIADKHVIVAPPPEHHVAAWTDVNTADELHKRRMNGE